MDSPETDAQVEANLEYAASIGMQGLPTTYIGERTVLGFDARRGPEPYREALAAARTERPAQRVWWPFGLVLAAVLALAALARPKARKSG